jgi:hypothetical protein
MWVEHDGDDWWFVVHFTQGPRRYEYRVRHLLDTGGVEGTPEEVAPRSDEPARGRVHGRTAAA